MTLQARALADITSWETRWPVTREDLAALLATFAISEVRRALEEAATIADNQAAESEADNQEHYRSGMCHAEVCEPCAARLAAYRIAEKLRALLPASTPEAPTKETP